MAEVVTSFDVVVPTIRRIELDRPWHWLARGWRDLTRAPALYFVSRPLLCATACANIRLVPY